MFNRAPGLCYTCLRNQTRSAGRRRTWDQLSRAKVASIPTHPSTPSSARRWQSAVAAVQVEDDDASSHSQSPSQSRSQPGPSLQAANTTTSASLTDIVETSNQSTTDSAPLNDGEPDSENQRPAKPPSSTTTRKHAHFKRWRPHKAEELGVNVLGKPAEVLIIPTRKPRSARPAQEEDTSEEKVGLQRSLDSELKPVSLEEVLKNIDSLKEELGQGRHDFSTTEWKEIKNRLGDGFTKMQLQEYLRIACDPGETGSHGEYVPPSITKRNMAAKIMAEAWNWRCGNVEDTVTVPAAPEMEPEPTRKTMVINALKLDYIMLHEKQQLGHISDNLNVQIHVFKKKSRIQLSGDDAAVQDAHTRLSELVKEVQESSVSLTGTLAELLSDKGKAESWLSVFMQKYRLLIRRRQDTLHVVGPAKANASLVLRDLLLLSGRLRRNMPFTIQTEQSQQASTHAPFYPNDIPHWLQGKQDWHRHISTQVSTSSVDATLKSGSREARRLAGNVLKSDKPNQERLSRYRIAPGSLSHDYTADLGQLLLNYDKSKHDTVATSSETQSVAESVLVLHQGFLPQVLTRKDFVSVTGPRLSQQNAMGLAHPFLLHLRLSSATESATCPRFELYLSGQDANLGLGQQLQIRRAFAVLDEWQHSLLLPHQPVDIVMKRQSRIDLLGGDGAEPAQQYLAILRQLASCLEQVNSSEKLELSPVWELDVSPLLNNKGSASLANREGTKVKDSNINSKPTASGSLKSTYILEPPEILDVASYTSELAGDRYIDHIVCETDPIDKPQQRQILRISHQSLSGLLYDEVEKAKAETTSTIEKQRWFKGSITAAYELATMLSEAQKSAGAVNASAEAADSVT